MTNRGKKRTETGIRIDPDFKIFIEGECRKKSVQEGMKITPARMTQAMYRQYMKYPDLLKEISRTKMGKWKPL